MGWNDGGSDTAEKQQDPLTDHHISKDREDIAQTRGAAVKVDPREYAAIVGPALCKTTASLVAQMVKKPPATREAWAGKIPCRRAGQPAPALLPGESHGQRAMTGYSPWGHKVSDTTERRGTSRGTRKELTVPVSSEGGGTPRQLPGVLTSKQRRQTGQRQEFRAHSGHRVRPWPELPTRQHAHGPRQGRGLRGLTSFRMD